MPETRTQSRDRIRYITDIFKENRLFIRKVISSKVSDSDTAEELFQELFVKLILRKLPDSIEDMQSFLYVAITRLAIDRREKENKYKEMLDKYRSEMYDFERVETEELFVREEQMRQVYHIIDGKLGPREADAVRLRYEGQMNIPEVATSLGIKKRSASRYISVALSKISKIMNNF